MCGFAGEFLTRAEAPPPREDVLVSMGALLRHRGPDGGGQVVESWYGLHHRRLAVIDLVTGDQPMVSPSGDTVVAFNGEIYNFRELRRELEGKGHHFQTRTDTEVLLHGYQEWGLDLPSRLRGMFAFALVDRVKRRLLLARDRLGQKPLYFSRLGDRILFASELKSLLSHPGLERRLDPGALWESLVFRYVPDPHCIFRGVEKLPPAHILWAEPGGRGGVESYWDLSFEERTGAGVEETAGALLEELDRAVDLRLVADVPLGAFLSGGVDSAGIVASMSRLREEVVAVSVGFQDAAFDERPAARAVAERLGVRLEEHLTTPEAAEDLDLLSFHFDEPFFDSSALPTYHVSRAARRHVTVALSGDGGDEAFAGYRRYRFDRWENRVRRFLPPGAGPFLLRPLGRAWPRSRALPRWMRAGATLENLGRDGFDAYVHSVSAQAPGEALSFLHPDLRRALEGYDPLEIHRKHFFRGGRVDTLSRVQYLDLKTYLPGDILVKVDRASMAVSLETRAPFLDHRLLEGAARVPPRYRIKGGRGKWILRTALVDRLGPGILDRPKAGFSIPLARWMGKDLDGLVREALEGEAANLLLDRKRAEAWREEHRSGRRDRSEALWALLVLHRWWERWGKGRAS